MARLLSVPDPPLQGPLEPETSIIHCFEKYLIKKLYSVECMIYLEPVRDCYLDFPFMILIASTHVQIPPFHDNYKEIIKCHLSGK